jgi:transcriptional regulator with XRE-family HTH domain
MRTGPVPGRQRGNIVMKKTKRKSRKEANPSEAPAETEGVSRESLAYFKIGDTVRKYRKEKNLKLQDLAALIEMSSSMLSKIENGRMIPTIPTLFTIINKLGIPVDQFFAELKEDEKFPGYIFIPQKDYVPYVKEENVRGFDYYSILERKIDSGSFQISLLHLSPGAQRAPVVTTAYEYVYLIHGTVRYSLGDQIFEMQAGDSLFFDGNIPHVPHNETKTMAIMLVVYLFTESNNGMLNKS